MSQDKTLIGIDFGTSYIKVCYFDEQTQEPCIIIDSTGNTCFPSVLSFEENRTLFGDAAKNNTRDRYCIEGIKRFIGQRFDAIPKDVRDRMNYEIREGEDGFCEILIPDPNDGEDLVFKPEELIAIQLAHIKQIILQQIPNPDFDNVAISVPVTFTDVMIQKMKEAFEIAGMKVKSIIRETSASVGSFEDKIVVCLRKN